MVAALAAASVFLLSGGAFVARAAPQCVNSLSGSNFEIDPDANLKVNTQTCVDWLAGGSGSAMRAGVLKKDDKPTGTTDDSFGQGTKEDDPNPTIIDGSIPNNKSDLKTFGLFPEVTQTGKFLALFWTRVNSPQGTTNMDFELNQKFCNPSATPTNCANNGVGVTPETPVRTAGDILITYDLSNGGTVPTISMRTWDGTKWGPPQDLTAANEALGSINSSTIAATDSGGLGALDPLTFGEAIISFDAIFPNSDSCGALGSAYLKSRSSDSFQSELKDFIAPEQISLSNCTSLTTTAQASVTLGQPIFDVAHLSGSTLGAGGTITFKAYGPNDPNCANAPAFTSAAIPVNGDGNYNSGNFTPTAVGTYLWTASYTGDQHNSTASTACGDANESSVVTKAPSSTATELHNNASEAVIALNSSVALGTNVHDKATVSDSVAGVDPTGTVSFTFFANNDCSGQGTAKGTVALVAGVAHPSQASGALAAGDYGFRAHYNGDSNFDASTSDCEPFHVNTATTSTATELHNDASEAVIALNSSVALGTNVHDKATVSEGNAAFNPTGDVSFTFFANNDCSGQGTAKGTVALVAGVAHPSQASGALAAGDYAFRAHYNGDDNFDPSTSPCEPFSVEKASPGITTELSDDLIRVGETIHDSATLQGASADAGGTVKYVYYSSLAACNDEGNTFDNPGGTSAGEKTVANGVVPDSDDATFNSAGTFYWRAWYSGDGNNEKASSGCQEEILLVISPGISISKDPASQTIRNPGTASWTITVENTGDTTLTGVHVDDAQAPGCSRSAAEIAADPNAPHPGTATFEPGDTYSYDCSKSGVTADFTNTAVVTGTPPAGEDVTAQDSADVDVISPHISVVKSPDSQTVVSGQTATFTIQVINDGDVTLTNVVVSDALAPGCARTKADIPGLASMPPVPAAGSTITYSCTLANVTSSFTNVATATGTPPLGPDVSSQDTAGVTVVQPVTHPAISIVKDPNSQTVTSGGTATFTITVLNTGDVTLTDVAVTDQKSPNCNRAIGTLAPGQSVSYKCTKPNVTADFDNVAVATGHAGSTTVTAQDTAHVNAKAPFVPPKPKVVSHKKPKTTG